MLKTLADCKPSEFLKQTNLIRKAVSRWLTDTDIINIRKRLPVTEIAPLTASVEEKAEVMARNEAAMRKQTAANITAILDAVMEDHPDETLEILALLCFVDPAHVDDHKITEYLDAFSRLIADEAVISFFTSLMQLDQIGTSTSAEA